MKMKDQLISENPSHPSEALAEAVTEKLNQLEVDETLLNNAANKVEDLKNAALDAVHDSDPELAQDLAETLDGKHLRNRRI